MSTWNWFRISYPYYVYKMMFSQLIIFLSGIYLFFLYCSFISAYYICCFLLKILGFLMNLHLICIMLKFVLVYSVFYFGMWMLRCSSWVICCWCFFVSWFVMIVHVIDERWWKINFWCVIYECDFIWSFIYLNICKFFN